MKTTSKMNNLILLTAYRYKKNWKYCHTTNHIVKQNEISDKTENNVFLAGYAKLKKNLKESNRGWKSLRKIS